MCVIWGLTASARSFAPSCFLSQEGALGASGARRQGRPIWKENQVRWHSSPKEQQVWIPPSLGFPGPRWPGKGLSYTALRETTSQDGVRWRGLWGGRHPPSWVAFCQRHLLPLVRTRSSHSPSATKAWAGPREVRDVEEAGQDARASPP